MAGKNIPLHYLSDESGLGISLQRIDRMNRMNGVYMDAHRDDHGNFFFQEDGHARLMVDFREIELRGSGVFCIMPGQVHYPLETAGSYGWFLGVDLSLLDEHHRAVVDEYALHGFPANVDAGYADVLARSLGLLLEFYEAPARYGQPLIQSMLKTCIGLFTSLFEKEILQRTAQSRPSALTSQFRKLLSQHFKTVKSPSDYAGMLNITSSYLNEVVKETSGQPVSHWIQSEVMMEAKRLLYYTDLNVKEIAFALGYDDQTYFSRLFRKVSGKSAGQFRDEYRK
ncbi:AraC family transcriptional regulator [Dyadobacter beijingensis]|uniref:AraC family transcriptional regulator n=1 Tax=Dyadobacter beijingensis TaxID=365489 RepID=A0ABQ2IFK0_9BACT|nr:helix-turn-helix domain-containing protein [Dyadobacter beijingensis]GGN05831.1 AraC family transcriptional regulator [Dyadobacter beijingensis]